MDHLQLRKLKYKEQKKREYVKNFYLKEEVGACRAVPPFVNSAYLCAQLIRSESSSPSLNPRLRLSPSPQSLNLFPDVIVQVGAAQSASSPAAPSPEPLGGSAALRRTDFPRLMQVRPRTQRTPVGGDRRRLDRPPHPRVQPQHMTVGRTASGRAAAGVGRREVFNRGNNHRPSYG